MPHFLAFKNFSVFYRYSNCKNILWKKICVGNSSLNILMRYQYGLKKKCMYLLFLNNAFLPTKDCQAKLNLSTNLFSVICKRPFCNHDDVVTPKILVPLDPITKKPIWNLETSIRGWLSATVLNNICSLSQWRSEFLPNQGSCSKPLLVGVTIFINDLGVIHVTLHCWIAANT